MGVPMSLVTLLSPQAGLPLREAPASLLLQTEELLWPSHLRSSCTPSLHLFFLLLAFQGSLATAGSMTHACKDVEGS